MPDLLSGFPPAIGKNSRILILGSMPGVESLQRREYYGHPRNAFWRIMAELLGFDASAAYATRLHELTRRGIALWDVVDQCVRSGSLDSAIQVNTVVANDIAGLIAAHNGIAHVYFNGTRAEQLYNKHQDPVESVCYRRLPSTSPAHAAMSYAAKLEHWRTIDTALRDSW